MRDHAAYLFEVDSGKEIKGLAKPRRKAEMEAEVWKNPSGAEPTIIPAFLRHD